MIQLIDETGLSVSLEYDEDGFPSVSIDTGDGFHSENLRPSVTVVLNDCVIHEMFDEFDERWTP